MQGVLSNDGEDEMDKLIYIIYPLLLAALLIGSRVAKKKEWNEEAFSLDQMKMLQGFIAVLIMCHHCGQKNSASWIDERYYTGGMEFFVPIGFVLVSFFTFCSGYGLYKSLKTKKDYLKKSFIAHRILPIIGTGYLVAMIFLLVRILLGENLKLDNNGLWYVLGLKLANPNGWYVIVIPFFYLAFYLAFRFMKSEKAALFAILVFTIAFQFLGASLDHNDWWMRGEWWYNSIHLFVVGIWFAKNEEKLIPEIKKHYKLFLIIGLLLILPLFILSEFLKGVFSYYAEYWNAPDKVFRRVVSLSGEVLFSSVVVLTAFIISLKVKIGNPFLKLMGKITLEFYLIHGLFSELFCFAFDGSLKSFYIKNQLLYVVVVFALGIPSALLIRYVVGMIKKLFAAS